MCRHWAWGGVGRMYWEKKIYKKNPSHKRLGLVYFWIRILINLTHIDNVGQIQYKPVGLDTIKYFYFIRSIWQLINLHTHKPMDIAGRGTYLVLVMFRVQYFAHSAMPFTLGSSSSCACFNRYLHKLALYIDVRDIMHGLFSGWNPTNY